MVLKAGISSANDRTTRALPIRWSFVTENREDGLPINGGCIALVLRVVDRLEFPGLRAEPPSCRENPYNQSLLYLSIGGTTYTVGR